MKELRFKIGDGYYKGCDLVVRCMGNTKGGRLVKVANKILDPNGVNVHVEWFANVKNPQRYGEQQVKRWQKIAD